MNVFGLLYLRVCICFHLYLLIHVFIILLLIRESGCNLSVETGSPDYLQFPFEDVSFICSVEAPEFAGYQSNLLRSCAIFCRFLSAKINLALHKIACYGA